MPKFADNAKALVKQYRRDAARAYLTNVATEHLQYFPQMCCYSFDDIAVELNVDGRADRYALDALVDLVRDRVKGRTILDIGANIGNHSLVFSEIAAKVIAFEPHPVTFELLKLNTRNHNNVVVVNSGASDSSAELRAVSPARNRGATSISDRPVGAGEESWTFTVEPLDSRTDISEADVALMKLDVEGHEEYALRGLMDTIEQKKPIVVIEQNASVILQGTSQSLEILRSSGYTYFYSIEVSIPWRTPQAMPTVLRRFSRVIESLIFGPADFNASIAPVSCLEHRDYPMLIASFEPLEVNRRRPKA